MRMRSMAPLMALVVSCVLMAAACGGLPGPDDPSDVLPEWPDVVDCTGPLVTDAIGKVTEILLRGLSGENTISDGAKSELLELGEEHGVETVACLVDRVVSDWSQPGASQTPERMSAAARGRDLFRSEGITVMRRPVPEASLMPPRQPMPPVAEPETYLCSLTYVQLACPDKRTARYGFVPLERDPFGERPWHAVLAGARGVRS